MDLTSLSHYAPVCSARIILCCIYVVDCFSQICNVTNSNRGEMLVSDLALFFN